MGGLKSILPPGRQPLLDHDNKTVLGSFRNCSSSLLRGIGCFGATRRWVDHPGLGVNASTHSDIFWHTLAIGGETFAFCRVTGAKSTGPAAGPTL